jgi:excinuclease UvrABC nuclease subunit
MYYVYRFINENGAIIYVGKTSDIVKRINQHFSENGHLPSVCYSSVASVECIELKSKIDMDIRELYFINKWKPMYNQKDKQKEDMNVILDESKDYWIPCKHKRQVSFSQYIPSSDVRRMSFIPANIEKWESAE